MAALELEKRQAARKIELTPHEHEVKTNYSAFVRQVFHTVCPGTPYLHNWHIDLMAEYLEACRRREIKRLLINLPPRMLKSIAVTIAWPAWLIGNEPSERVIAASYAESLSLKHSVDCRLVMQSDWYRKLFPRVELAYDQNEKRKFMTTSRGYRLSTSVGGSVIGEGGNVLIFDDPLNPLQASSKLERERANDWYDQSFSTRLDDKKTGIIVGVMQRLDENDLTGHLLEKGGFTHLKIPAIAPTRTIIDFGKVKLVREAGEPMHAEREPLEVLERQKIEMGSMAFAGQYQQEPAPAEGGLFKLAWLGKRYEKRAETYTRIVQSWDTAVKPDQIHDPSCCITFGEKPNGCDILDVRVVRKEYPDLKRLVISHAADFKADAILIEDKASGQQLLQDLGRETPLPIIGIQATTDKVTRASACSSLIEAGRVFLPENASWLQAFMTELLLFPNGAHDDQVDALSQYLNWLKNSVQVAPRIRRL